MTLNLSEAKNHGCRPHPRGSVRRASGFVLTGYPEVMPGQESTWGKFATLAEEGLRNMGCWRFHIATMVAG